jgi:MoCo/4Fe-4S cofactor protein with predicted Tat translocation signal
MNPRKHLAPKLAALQARLEQSRGKQYWRSLEELANTAAFQELVRQEFPGQSGEAPVVFDRRRFLTLMGASLALAGLSGCTTKPAPWVDIVPPVRAPEEIIPSRPLYFATAMSLGGAAVGLLVEQHSGRPTKIEGNPQHPASLGATDLFSQASILTFYDPDRSPYVTLRGQPSTWDAALGKEPVRDTPSVFGAVEKLRPVKGRGLRVLSETILSPTLAAQVAEFRQAFPESQWHQYEPILTDSARQAARFAFGEPVHTYPDLTKADVVVSLDADFLDSGPGNLRSIADFMSRRRVRTKADDAAKASMNRLYVFETAVSNTGAKADHRLAVPMHQIEAIARALASELGVAGVAPSKTLTEPVRSWVRQVAADVRFRDPQPGQPRRDPRPPGTTLVLAGHRQPVAVHLLAHAINQHLGNFGHTVIATQPVEAEPVDQLGSLRDLVAAMDRDEVKVLLILGSNPVFTAPVDLHFTQSMQRVPLRVHLGLFQDETARQCHWHLPEAHFLEAWSDVRTFDGTASIMQPLIAPLYEGRSVHELLAWLIHGVPTPGYDRVRARWQEYWKGQKQSGKFEEFWEVAVHDGIVEGTRFPPTKVQLRADWHTHLPAPVSEQPRPLEIVFQADPTLYDGRFANNGWLQELPKPMTQITWDNAAIMSLKTAKELGLWWGGYAHGGEHGGYQMPVVELRLGKLVVSAPLWIMPGHADGSVTVSLGYGRPYAGRLGGTPDQMVGFDAYQLRTSEHPWFAPGLAVTKTPQTHLVACTQQHHLMEGREVVRSATLDEYRRDPAFAKKKEVLQRQAESLVARKPLTIYTERYDYGLPKHKWGMVIDLTTCVGCKACVVACQSENNIPIVGKEQVAAGREMHWLRVDRYIKGPYERPEEFHFQPVPCQQCEKAPCEYVCPVEATVHSAEGLNDMIYNRCVGTRFCSNNCPYKVRRFNFFEYGNYQSPSRNLQYNPNVTVRTRGVMEKCTYCVQRIRTAEQDALVEHRPIRDGDVLTACQAACPAQAIVFGDLNDSEATVTKWKESPLEYALLGDLDTRPRTTYLGALRNPNPEMGSS